MLLMMASGGYFYFKHSQSVISNLTEDNARLEISVRQQEATIAAQRDAASRQNSESLRLQQTLADAESQRRLLENRLRARNLEAMARADSADLERRINRATVEAFRDIETLTGSNRTPSPGNISENNQSRTSAGGTVSNIGTLPTNHQPPPRPPVRGNNIGSTR